MLAALYVSSNIHQPTSRLPVLQVRSEFGLSGKHGQRIGFEGEMAGDNGVDVSTSDNETVDEDRTNGSGNTNNDGQGGVDPSNDGDETIDEDRTDGSNDADEIDTTVNGSIKGV